MTIQRLIRLLGAGVLALVLFFVIRSVLESQEADAEQALALEIIEEALDARHDYSEALRLSAGALLRYPEDGRLYLLRARAFHGLGRLSDALRALEQARRFSEDSDERKEIQFYTASSRILRFLETGDRDDYNLAEGDLRRMADGGRFSAAARVLLGQALARPSRFQDRKEALRLLEEGLQEGAATEGRIDPSRARKTLESLRAG